MRVGLLNRIVLLERIVNRLIGALANLGDIQATGVQTFTTISLIMLRYIFKKSVVCSLQFTPVHPVPQYPKNSRMLRDNLVENCEVQSAIRFKGY